MSRVTIASPSRHQSSEARAARHVTSHPPYRGGDGDVTQTPPVPVHLARAVADLAERVARLSVSHRDPEAFFVRKSEIAAELHEVARRMRAPA